MWVLMARIIDHSFTRIARTENDYLMYYLCEHKSVGLRRGFTRDT